jgi:methionyl-tRNA formyltransferase
VAHAIAHGDQTTGVSVFELEVGLDTGPVLAEVEVPIGDRVTTGQLLNQLTMAGSELVTKVLADFDSYSAAASPQSTSGVSFAPRLQVMDAKIRWANSVTEADRWLRAVTPNPGGWSTFAGGRVNISPFKEIAVDDDGLTARLNGLVDGFDARATTPGQMLVAKSEVWVACKSGGALLDSVQPAGKNLMAATDWVRGLRGQSLQFS